MSPRAKSGQPRGRKPTVRPPRLQPVVLQTRITKGTRDKLDHYISWINDPETYRTKSAHAHGFTRADLEDLPRSIARVVEEALQRYLTDLLTERIDNKPNMQERSHLRQHPEAADPDDHRPIVRAIGARIPATPKSKPKPHTDLRI